ncbi:MAG: hypothetical protein KDK54_05045 [Leptospiraceae bacterium]|nr:hypothetical protein [Leptospiraceae bacterium]
MKREIRYLRTLIFLITLLATPLLSEKIGGIGDPKTEDDYEDKEEKLPRTLEIGFRIGQGYKAEDRLESNLRDYKTYSGPNVYSKTFLSPFSYQTNTEAFFRTYWDDRSKVGFTFGNLNFDNFLLEEYNSAGEYTRLKFQFNTMYFFLNYHYQWRFRKNILEAGLGLGVNHTEMNPNGYYYSRFGYYDQSGYMGANGLSYRVEAAWNRFFTANYFFQLGASISMHTAPAFSGSFNDESGALYLRSDGSLGILTNSDITNSVVLTNYASRNLDLKYSTFQITLGLGTQFDY